MMLFLLNTIMIFFTRKKVSAPVISVGETNLKSFAYERITRLPRVGSYHLKKLWSGRNFTPESKFF